LSWDTWVAVAYIIILYSCSRLKSQMLERGKASAHPRGVGRVAERGADNRLPASGGERGQRLREKRSKLLKGRKKEIKTERERGFILVLLSASTIILKFGEIHAATAQKKGRT
jgi:hypothetical protein